MDVRLCSDPEARTTAENQSERSAKYEETRRSMFEETRRGNVDHRMLKVYLTQQFRKNTLIARKSLKRLIQEFEKNPNRDSLMEDLNKIEEFNTFGE